MMFLSHHCQETALSNTSCLNEKLLPPMQLHRHERIWLVLGGHIHLTQVSSQCSQPISQLRTVKTLYNRAIKQGGWEETSRGHLG